ncbi:MAG: 50S ribosome-binding GTPase [Actinobacteria bacterium]|nr:50S ribosome-binding GTPase [Actinomycetota bacterium]
MTEMSAESVRARAAALRSALASGAGCLPADGVGRAEAAIAKTTARTSIAGGCTVIALAGATGSGKSSLFNALIGAEVAQAGVRRPTTETSTAAVWGSESASALLDWLMVGARHMVDERPADAMGSDFGPADHPVTAPARPPGLQLDGLVLLDLPDFDSHATAHRVEAERVLDLVDVFIWVTDPQKYADARLHEDYVAKLSAHDAVTVAVLNQADRLSPEALAACRSDLVRLLGADGVVDAEVIATSATGGSGVVDLRHRISAVVAGHTAAVQRLDSDLRSAATALRCSVADSEPRLDDSADAHLVDALSRAAGIPIILDAVERDFRRESWARTGWPFTRWALALRPAPLTRLRLNRDASDRSGVISQSDVRSVLGRSSLPPATPAARSAVALATRELGDRAGRELPQAWTDAVTDAATPPGEDLGDVLDQAVVGTSLRARNPLWWTVFGTLQGILGVAAVAGLIWLVALMALGSLQLKALDVPRLGPLPYPFLLLAGGLFIGFLISQLTRAIGRVGGRRRRVLVAARLRDSVVQVARDRLVAPVQEVLDRHRVTREHLEAALRRA